MYARALAAFVLAFAFVADAQAADALYRREVNQKNPDGKDLVMTVEEVRRDEKTSTLKVTFTSGSSVPSIMLIVRGSYDIAQARSSRYFIKLKEWQADDGAWMYLVGFSNDKQVDHKFFGLSEPLPKSDEHQFMAVEQFDPIFKGKP
jgi:hypothetical protein